MPAEQRRHVTYLRVLRAMANPVRYRIFSHLMSAGPQTASECAEVVGASPSNCSYHLRELERSELAALVADVDALLRPYIGLTREDAPADAAPVHVAFQAFRLPGDA